VSNRYFDVFPPDDRLALFTVSMCAANNDVWESDQVARAANPRWAADDPHHVHRTRFTYQVRRSIGHLFEAIAALKAWREDEPVVRSLIASLSSDGKARLKLVCGLEQRIGPDALRQVRNNSFHYPKPKSSYSPDPVDELADAIRMNGTEPASFDVVTARVPTGAAPPPPRRLYRFGDQLMLSIAFGAFDPDVEKGSDQTAQVGEAAEAFCALVDELYDLYSKYRRAVSTPLPRVSG
jgi:hypothetical protein